MSIDRSPGNFSHTSLGRNWHARKGWRRFHFNDSRCRQQNDQGVTVGSNAAVPCTVDETSGNTVITFLGTHSGGTLFSMDGLVAGMPLLTDEGSVLTFDKPFVLKTMIELVSISGDHSDTSGENMTQPQIVMGLTMETGVDFANLSSRYISSGVRIRARSSQSELVNHSSDFYTEQTQDSSSPSTKFGSANPTGTTTQGCSLFISEFQVGPDLSTTTNNTRLFRQAFQTSGNNYATPQLQITDVDTSNHNGFNNANTPVTLFAAVQDIETDTFGSEVGGNEPDNTPCVLTCRLWYMVEADFYNGFGGSGSV